MKRQPRISETPDGVNVFSRTFRGAFASVASSTAELLARVEAVERRLVRVRQGGGPPRPGITLPAIVVGAIPIGGQGSKWRYSVREAKTNAAGTGFDIRSGGFSGKEVLNLYEVSAVPPKYGYGWSVPSGTEVTVLRIPSGSVVALHFTTDLIEEPAEGTPLGPTTGPTDPAGAPRAFFMAPNPIEIVCTDPRP